MRSIFTLKLDKTGWILEDDIQNDIKKLDTFIEERKEKFFNYGGDIDTLITCSKIVHGRRVFGKDPSIRKKLTMKDIEQGYTKMLQSKKEYKNKLSKEVLNAMFI